MVLVDTSVWVEPFRAKQPLDLAAHDDLDEIVTCLPVIEEVLLGFGDERAYRRARDAMLSCDRDYPALAQITTLRHRSP